MKCAIKKSVSLIFRHVAQFYDGFMPDFPSNMIFHIMFDHFSDFPSKIKKYRLGGREDPPTRYNENSTKSFSDFFEHFRKSYMYETNKTPQNGMPYIGMGVDDILNPNKDGVVKKPYMGDGFGYEGGSILTPFFDNKGELKLSNVGDKVLRLG